MMVRFRRDMLYKFFRRRSPGYKIWFVAGIWGTTLLNCPIAQAASRSESALNLLLHAAASAESHHIPIGYATTRLTKPKTRTGLVDYLAAENAMLSKDVTLKNNAAVKFYEVLGAVFCGNEALWGAAYPPNASRTRWQRAVLSAWHIPRQAVSQGEIITFATFCRAGVPGMPSKAFPPPAKSISRARKFLRHPWASAPPDELAAQWLTANHPALVRIRQACNLPHFYIPLVIPSLIVDGRTVRTKML